MKDVNGVGMRTKILMVIIVSLGIIFGAKQAIATNRHKHQNINKPHSVNVKKKSILSQKSRAIKKRTIRLAKKTTQVAKKSKPIKTLYKAVVNGTNYYGNQQLAYKLNQLIQDNAESANISVYVRSMRYGDPLYVRGVTKLMTPASTLKVMTAEAAFIYLKPDFRFTTRLLTNAKTIKNGILQGHLYIALSGDPTLTYQDIVALITELRSQSIYGVSGNVYIDYSAYDQRFYGPNWEDKDKSNCYAAPISAGIVNHNCLPVRFSPSRTVGRAAIIETSSKHFYPPIRNSVVTTSRRSRSCGLRLSNDLSRGLEIDGCIARGQTPFGMSYVVNDVTEYNRALFATALRKVGIRVNGNVRFATCPHNLSMIAYHSSHPLSELVTDMLKKSDNVIAGALFKKIGQLYTGRQGSWENGSAAVAKILSTAAKMNTVNLKILDGSGLSPANLVTSEQIMQVLDHAYHHSSADDFIAALPVAGVDGTLKNRMSHLARKVRAKTGTISGVVSLAGYVTTSDQEDLAFVILVNGKKALMWKYRELEDNIVTALAQYKR